LYQPVLPRDRHQFVVNAWPSAYTENTSLPWPLPIRNVWFAPVVPLSQLRMTA
jgi:hypothetical protein